MAASVSGDTIKDMTGAPYGASPGGSWPPPAVPPNFEPARRRTKMNPFNVVCLVASLLAIAIAIGSWFKPTVSGDDIGTDAESRPRYTAEELKTATAAVCDARELAGKAGSVAGGKTSDDPDMRFVVAINSRLASAVSADYLTYVLSQNPATPDSLSSPVRRIIEALNEITLLNLADSEQSALEPLYKKLDDADSEAAQECK